MHEASIFFVGIDFVDVFGVIGEKSIRGKKSIRVEKVASCKPA